MKKCVLFLILLATTAMAFGQIKVASNGNVGIGSSISGQTAKLQVNGHVRIDAWTDILIDWSGSGTATACTPTIYPENNGYLQLGKPDLRLGKVYLWDAYSLIYGSTSDERLKENIEPLKNPIERIKQISGYNYNFKREIFPKELPEDFIAQHTKKQIGFIAQEMEKVFPELVLPPGEGEEYYSINYDGMIPVLLEAIKEQQNQIEKMQSMVSKQANEMLFLQEQLDVYFQNNPDNSLLKNMPTGENFKQNKEGKLFQNAPNPFNVSTEIRFEIPENTTSAQLLIYNMQGAEIKSYGITTKGAGSVTIQGSEFAAGMYMYTLLVNNAVVDSKRMILTK